MSSLPAPGLPVNVPSVQAWISQPLDPPGDQRHFSSTFFHETVVSCTDRRNWLSAKALGIETMIDAAGTRMLPPISVPKPSGEP